VLNIGILSAEWHWRRRFKPSILTGRKQRKVLSAHRGAANSTRQAAVAERRAAISHMMGQTSLNRVLK